MLLQYMSVPDCTIQFWSKHLISYKILQCVDYNARQDVVNSLSLFTSVVINIRALSLFESVPDDGYSESCWSTMEIPDPKRNAMKKYLVCKFSSPEQLDLDPYALTFQSGYALLMLYQILILLWSRIIFDGWRIQYQVSWKLMPLSCSTSI